MNLSEIRAGEWVVIDTNILVYANQQKSAEAVQLLRRCASREVLGIVPMPMVAELVHTLMLIEARENGWIEKSNPARALSEHPELVRRLSRYETQVREFLGIGLRIEATTTVDIIEAMNIQREFGLLTNDALFVATARRLSCPAMATADSGFAKLKGFLIYGPSDLEP
jgi:predicted nucleic acid-binding protein